MEMHQIRYFLATSRTLNFTRAAEECNVAQPSLTRAIKLLEDELGGELFRRERNLTHLTELGTRMLPLLQQCYDSAVNAKSLASSLKSGEVAPLSLGLSSSIGMHLFVDHLREIVGAMPGLELKFLRGDRDQIGEALKKGDVELAIAGSLGREWERFDSWELFEEDYRLLVARSNPLAGRNSIQIEQLRDQRYLVRTYCEMREELDQLIQCKGPSGLRGHDVASDSDLGTMLAADLGIAIGPQSTALPGSATYVSLDGLDFKRKVFAYGVAGRQRSVAAMTLLKMLRAADWSGVLIR